MNTLKHFAIWLPVPIESICNEQILTFIDLLREKRLKAKTINCYLQSIRGFYDYLYDEEGLRIPNPVKRGYALRESKPLPKYLKDHEIANLFACITKLRDRSIFKIMLRCGLRVDEVANLTREDVYLRRRMIHVKNGKGGKGRIVFMSNDALIDLIAYLEQRSSSVEKKIFLVEKGSCRGKPISVRGIQKRMEYYSKKANLKISSHHLRHTMATQLLNAGMDLVSIQDLLGHTRIKTTERYTKVSNVKVMKDYFKAIEEVERRSRSNEKKVGNNWGPPPKPPGFIAL
jgi:site-specific recombinase XerD